MEGMCRLCLISETGEDIFEKGFDKVIKDSFGIKLQMIPNWPSHACITCINYLNGLNDFRATIAASQKHLKELESQPVEEIITEIVEVKNEEIEILDMSYLRRSSRSKSKPKDSPPPKRAKRVSIKKERSPSPPLIPEKKPKRKYEKLKTKSPSPVEFDEGSVQGSDSDTNDNSHQKDIPKSSGIAKRLEEIRAPLEEQLRKMNLLHCDKCKFKADSFRMLNRHYHNAHKTWGYVRCCKRRYNRHDVHDHMAYHLDNNAFVCDECGKVWKSGLQLRGHKVNSHMPPEECKFECETCGRRLPSISHYNAHLKSHIPKDQRAFKCDLCDRRFNVNILLQKHILSKHSNLTTFVCEICGKGMASADQLKGHSQTHMAAQTAECDICGKHFFNVAQHKKRIHGPQTKINCEHCGLLVRDKYYKSHLKRLHTDVKIYKCNVCEKEFKLLCSYNVHMDIHLGVKYDCYFCPHQATSVPNRIKHMKEKHLDEYMEYRRNKFTEVRVKNMDEKQEIIIEFESKESM